MSCENEWEAIDVLNLPFAKNTIQNTTILAIQNIDGKPEAVQISLLSLVGLVLQQIRGITNDATGVSIINDATGNTVNKDSNDSPTPIQSQVTNDATGQVLINDATGNPVNNNYQFTGSVYNDATGQVLINDATGNPVQFNNSPSPNINDATGNQVINDATTSGVDNS